MEFSGEFCVLFVFVSALFRFYLVFDVGAAHFWEFVGFLLAFLRFYWVCAGGAAHSWELVGNCLEISWWSLACAWPIFGNCLGFCGN